MHAFFASLHLPVSVGVALLALVYALKVAAGAFAFSRYRRWRAQRSGRRS